MTTETIIRRFIAVAQTRTHDQAPHGYNYNVFVAFRSSSQAATASLDRALKQLDHKSLGVDLKLDFEPTTPNLAKWIFETLQKDGLEVNEVVLARGDGFKTRYWQP